MITKNTTGLEKCSNGKIAPIGKFPFSKPKGRLRSGFTIVELLIVIVVIGIIAVIAIVAYNGIQKRAQTAQVISSVDSLEKSMRMAAAEGLFDGLPSGNEPEHLHGRHSGCIGTLSDYPATDKFEQGECLRTVGLVNGSEHIRSEVVNDELSALLLENGYALPDPIPEVDLGEGWRARGVGVVVDARVNEIALTYFTPDASSCGRGSSLIHLSIEYAEYDPGYMEQLESIHGPDWRSVLLSQPDACVLSLKY